MVYTPASVHQTVSQFEKAVQLYSAYATEPYNFFTTSAPFPSIL